VDYPNGASEAEFTNKYLANGEITLEGTKLIAGNRAKAVQADEFTFTVFEGTEKVAAGSTLEGGKIAFTAIKYDQDDIGTHEYVITEDPGSDGTLIYASSAAVTVTVSDAGKGKLNAAATYPEGGLTFTNQYQANGKFTLAAEKVLTGNRAEAIQAGEFTFTVTEEGAEGPVATGETAEGGTIIFTPIAYTQEDIGKTYTYVITEDKGQDESIDYKAAPVTVKVAISDVGNGALTIEPTYSSQKFTNEYHASGSIDLEAKKLLDVERAAEVGDGEFTFSVMEGDTEVATGTTQPGGEVKFTTIEYTEQNIGEHEYVISEVVPEEADQDPTIRYTAEPITVKVTVSDLGGGKLEAVPEYPVSGAEFLNEYKAEGQIELTAVKELTGGRPVEIGENEFTFVVTEDGTEVATGATLAGGEVKFTPISYTQDDINVTHHYVITENAGTDATITYNAAPVEVDVKVTDAGEGKLNAEPTYPEGGAKFVNEYHTSDTVLLTAKKTLTGATLQAGQFQFELKDAEGKTLQIQKNAADGTVVFDELEYNETDIGHTYTYTVSETDTGLQGITYSDTVYTVKVAVATNSDNTLATTTEITTKDHSVTEMLFENSFAGSATLLKIGPDGERLKNAEFELYQKTDKGWELYTADQTDGTYTTGEDGLLKVTGLTENEYYFIEAVAPDGYITAKDEDGSTKKYSFKIGLNDPEASVDPEFNIPNDKTSVEILKQDKSGKAVKGAVLRVVDEDGNKMDEWTTDGSAHEIKGILAGGQTYRLVEVSAPAGYKIAEDVTFTVKADGATGKVTMKDEKINLKKAVGSAKVTKHLIMSGGPLAADDASFYVALFEDAACTKRVSEIKTLTFQASSSDTEEFQNLEIGKTYYLSETDENGTAIAQGTLLTGEIYVADYTDGQKFTAQKDEAAELSFNNEFFTLPSGFYLEGELTITKKYYGADGEAKDSDEVFYAGIYEDPDFTQPAENVSENVVALSLNGASEASTVVRVSMPDSGTTTLYVTEVDETGTPVANAEDFQYTVSVDNPEVTLTTTEFAAEVVITNTELTPDETETEPEEPDSELTTEPETEPETEPKTTLTTEPKTTPATESETTKSVKTGDETPIETYVILLAASAVILLIAEERKRRRNVQK
jgi:pilin isopeptide linkage protein